MAAAALPEHEPDLLTVVAPTAGAARALAVRAGELAWTHVAQTGAGWLVSWRYAPMPESPGEPHALLQRSLDLVQAWVDQVGPVEASIGSHAFTMQPR